MAASSGSMTISQNIQLNLNSTTFEIPAYILDDLCSRFILNIPEEERTDLIRIFFQIELAHWFYLDFYCQENIDLKACGIKEFSKQVFHHCPTLIQHADNADKILLSWREYKMAVPTFGAILLDPTFQSCLLVQGFWAKASWGFPKGKVNEDETPHDCAIREVLEETGFDIASLIDREEFIEFKMNEQLSRLYIIHPVSMNTKFMPRTRKEIKKLEWFNIEHLPSHKKDLISKQYTGLNPNSFFMVIPFIKPLRRWIARRQGHELNTSGNYGTHKPGRKREKQGQGDGRQGDNRQVSEKQRQHQQKHFSQQMQSELQDVMKIREPRNRCQSQSDVANVSRQHKQTGSHGNKQQAAVSPKPHGSKKHDRQYHILKRDGTLSGNARRTLEYDSERSSAYVGYNNMNNKHDKTNNQNAHHMKPGTFFSPSLANFKLDANAVMNAMFPQSNISKNIKVGS